MTNFIESLMMISMRWAQLLSPARLGSRKRHTEQSRSPFHKDYDRIIFSQSFRQLDPQNPVHPLTQNDAIHTRLTHSLEVSCVGHSLGMLAAEKLKDDLPPWVSPADVGAIIQAACLAHDIGNPPFGHAGEYAIREWFTQPAQAHCKKNSALSTLVIWRNLKATRKACAFYHGSNTTPMMAACA